MKKASFDPIDRMGPPNKPNDFEQYQEERERRVRVTKRRFYWLIFCILFGVVVVKGIALIPESKPDYDKTSYSETSGEIIWDSEGKDLIFTLDIDNSTSSEIIFTTPAGGIDGTLGDSDELNETIEKMFDPKGY